MSAISFNPDAPGFTSLEFTPNPGTTVYSIAYRGPEGNYVLRLGERLQAWAHPQDKTVAALNAVKFLLKEGTKDFMEFQAAPLGEFLSAMFDSGSGKGMSFTTVRFGAPRVVVSPAPLLKEADVRLKTAPTWRDVGDGKSGKPPGTLRKRK